MKTDTGRWFALALCNHLKLSPERVAEPIKMNTGVDEIFSVDLKVYLTADDLSEIARIMKSITPDPAPTE